MSNNSMEGTENDGVPYDYKPSTVAAVIFAILYTPSGVWTLYQFIRTRCWFWIFMVIAALMEPVGYYFRIISTRSLTNITWFLIQYLLIFLAPAVIAASCYMAMGRVVLHVTPKNFQTMQQLWVTPRWMTPVFVGCDVVAFLIQIAGGIQVSSTDPKVVQRAFTIMKAGLAVQLFCFGLFIIIAVRFHFISRTFRSYWPDDKWTKFLWAINISAVLIFLRSVYRMIEFTQGETGYLATHEWAFYAFEGVVMLPAIIIFNFYHPADYVSNISFRQKRDVVLGSDAEDGEHVRLDSRQGSLRPAAVTKAHWWSRS